MSHSHRDDNELTAAALESVSSVDVTAPAPVVTNTETERRAAERRKSEEVPEQAFERQFTGDIPEPTRGGTDVETRVHLGDDAAHEDAADARSVPSRRGPPPPRALQFEDESWAAAPRLDVLSATTVTADRWVTPIAHLEASVPTTSSSWTRRG